MGLTVMGKVLLNRHQELELEHEGDIDRWQVERRYNLYLKRGHDEDDAFQYAVASVKNMNEQAQRRRGHDTGCER
jgi:hypothetical protein